MSMENLEQQRVHAFFSGKLSPEARQTLLAELQDNQALQDEFEFQQALFLRLQREAIEEHTAKKTISPRWYPYAAAAAIALLLAVGWLFTRRPESPASALLAFAAPTGHLPGQTKQQGLSGTDSLAYWLKTEQYRPLRQQLVGLPSRIPAGRISPAHSDSLYALAVALLHGSDPEPEQASHILEAVATRSEDAFLRSWASRQLVYAAFLQGDQDLTRARLKMLADEAEDPALRREAQQLWEAY